MVMSRAMSQGTSSSGEVGGCPEIDRGLHLDQPVLGQPDDQPNHQPGLVVDQI